MISTGLILEDIAHLLPGGAINKLSKGEGIPLNFYFDRFFLIGEEEGPGDGFYFDIILNATCNELKIDPDVAHIELKEYKNGSAFQRLGLILEKSKFKYLNISMSPLFVDFSEHRLFEAEKRKYKIKKQQKKTEELLIDSQETEKVSDSEEELKFAFEENKKKRKLTDKKESRTKKQKIINCGEYKI